MPPSCNVLHVDDDEDICVIVELSLSLDGGISVRSANNGRAALDILHGSTDIDLLLIDYQMPDMTGPELFVQARSLPGYAALPVVFLTARADAGVQHRIAELGATGVLIKPFDPMNLAHDIRRLMSDLPNPV